MTYREIHKEIESNLNKMANQYDFRNHAFINKEIEFTFGNYLEKEYRSYRKIYDFRVISNFPNVDVFIHLFKGSGISLIKLLRFERMRKLRELETIAKTL
jgi:hypothetical protein